MTVPVFGAYVPASSPVHRLDPRSKLLAAAILIAVALVVRSWYGLGLLALATAAAAALGRLPPGYLLRGLRPVLVFAAFTFAFQVVFTTGGAELARLGPVRVTADGVAEGLRMTLRLLLVVATVLVVTLTTRADELAEGVERLLAPLRLVGADPYEVAFVTTGALRFVPTLLEQAEKVRRAQMARGVDFETGTLFARVRRLFPLLVPLVISSLRRAEELGLAMEARGYRGGAGRVPRRRSRMGPADLVALAATLLAAALALVAGP